MKKIIILILLLISINGYSQSFKISGNVKSATDSTELPGAAVVLEQASDTHNGPQKGVITDISGNFILPANAQGDYVLRIQFIGFEPQRKNIEVKGDDVDLGVIYLKEEITTLREIEVVASVPVGEQKSDTSQFNAGAFKTAPDANAQDLVEKMPGIVLQDGKIQAQGEDVQQILIDGKPFFGEDAKAALQNLPADVIQSIQVFDQLSDKALLTGFDDGERKKTINIITKPDRRKGKFGKATLGYGTDDRYMAGASVNFFNERRRFTVTGLSNNINSLSYSADPNSDADARTQDGIITTNSVGINFIDSWKEGMDIQADYFYTHRKNESYQSRLRDFVLPGDSGQIYRENRINLHEGGDHRANMRFDYTINKRNRVIIRPSFSLKDNQGNSSFTGQANNATGPINQTENSATTANIDYDFHNRMFYSHRFANPRRSITFNLNTSYHKNEGDDFRLARNVFFNEEERSEILNQYSNLTRRGLRWHGKASYTEPLGKNGQLELEYEIGNTYNDSDKRTYNFLESLNDYVLLDTILSNTFKSDYLTQEVELGYQYKIKNIKVQVEAEYQRASLQNDQFFPQPFYLERLFHNILPSARLDYKISKTRNFEFNYRTWTNEPSIAQLQNVIDNSNPLQLRTGNPNLAQAYNNFMRAQYRSHNPETNRSFFINVQSNFVKNFIANSIFIADQAIELSEGVTLERGSQLNQPVNVQGFYNARAFFSYGQPVGFIKSNLNFNGSVNRTRRPGLINNDINVANSTNFRLGASLSSNISENVDFNIFTRSSYNMVDNSLRPNLNNNFFNQNTRIRFNWIVWEGLVFRTDFNHQAFAGLTEGFDNSFMLWNMSLGKKLFKNQLGEVSMNVFDLLNQNNNIRRNITEVFIEDFQSNVLQRYFMLTFTYNIRHFGRGTTIEDYEKLHNN